ncbi:hypothetical protein PIB30_049923 [Stylosanthes scabra]|uniref:TF-B3 domain-containing protein n=1 Tax=Stylosanthes scabra TaxID=79078 RepID=A0ABU6QGU1_9FABA|nr:hypothetical protein [Stylosanthes scabra]
MEIWQEMFVMKVFVPTSINYLKMITGLPQKPYGTSYQPNPWCFSIPLPCSTTYATAIFSAENQQRGRRMRRLALVCEDCAGQCVLLHGEDKKSSLLASSFFKIMLDSDFSTIMYLPHKFKPTVAALVNKKVILDDKSGKTWKVTLSEVRGHLALKEGWNKFSSDHGLERGDFLVFHHICDVLFYVDIYDKSGCQKLCLSDRRNKTKRRRDSSGSPVRDVMLATPTQDQNISVVSEPKPTKTYSRNKVIGVGGTPNNLENVSKHDKSNGIVQSMSIPKNYENTWKITTEDPRVSPIDYRLGTNPVDAILRDNFPSFEERLLRGAAPYLSEAELSGKMDSIRNTERRTYKNISTSKLGEERKENNVTSLKREVKECQYAQGLESDLMTMSKGKHGLRNGGCPNAEQNGIPSDSNAIQNGEISKKIKSEPVNRNPSKKSTFKDKASAEGEMSKRIKIEQHMDMTYNVPKFKYELEAKDIEVPKGLPKFIKKEFEQSSLKTDQDDHNNDDDDDNVQLAKPVRCVVPDDNDNFLKLPEHLHRCRNYKCNRMVVILQDPQRRLWPVLYHDHESYDLMDDDPDRYSAIAFHALAKGWSQFRRANNIQPGDVCTFELKEEPKHIFNVDIVHN